MKRLVTKVARSLSEVFAWKDIETTHRAYLKQIKRTVDTSPPLPSPILADVLRNFNFEPDQQMGLMALTKINHEARKTELFASSYPDHLTALNALIRITQELRRQGAERWSEEDIVTKNILQTRQTEIKQAATMLGCVNATIPDLPDDYVLVIPGALDERFELRANIAADMATIKKPSRLIIATGFRQLQPQEYPKLTGDKRTEAHMCKHILQQTAKKRPSLSGIPVELSVAPLKPNQVRSNTQDTADYLGLDSSLIGKELRIAVEQPYSNRFLHTFSKGLPTSKVAVYAIALEKTGKPDWLDVQSEVAGLIYSRRIEVRRKYKLTSLVGTS